MRDDLLKKTTLEFDCQRLMVDVMRASGKTALRDIAAMCDVSTSTLSRLNNWAVPDMATFMQLCTAFDLQPGDYFRKVTWKGELA